MTTSTPNKKSVFDGRKMWFLFAAIASAVVAILSFSLISVVTATESYYVLTEDVPARTQITAEILGEVTVARGATPPNALSLSELVNNEVFTLIELQAGDILTSSNTGDLVSLYAGLPDDFVIASFIAQPSAAAGGNIRRGDYIDILALINDPTITESSSVGATYALQRVLVIDATVDLDSYDGASEETVGGTGEANTGEQIAQRSGIPTLFTVGLTQENAAILAVATQFDLFVVLSSIDSQNGNVNENPGSATAEGLWGDGAPNAGLGTDNTFGAGGDVVRPGEETPSTPSEQPSTPSTPPTDENGEPVEEPTDEVTEEPTPEETATSEG